MKKYIIACTLLAVLGGNHLTASAQTKAWPDSIGINDLPSIPFLPDPLVLDEGKKDIPIITQKQWYKKRDGIRGQYQHWISGSVPPPPETFHVKVLREKTEGGVKLQMAELSFGPGYKAKMTVELMIPLSAKALPVFMTQWNHRGWAQVAVRRGYISCVYAGADVKDDTKNYNEIFAGYDFATLMKRAWGASRVIDYLYQLPEVDTARIALTGHSRNGKQSLMAAAFDKRIKAVVSSSGGTGGESTFRWSDERFDSESLEEITRNFPHWFSPRLHWFAGREQKLPVDQNSLMSLIAPRGLMLVSAITEEQGNPWGIGQSYQSVKKVYHFLKADAKIAILLRRGRHQHAARDVEDFIDFFDYIFGRSHKAPENKLYYDYSFEKWEQLSGESIDPLKFPVGKKAVSVQQDSIRNKVCWLLGDEPSGVPSETLLSSLLKKNSTYPDDYLEEVISESSLPAGIKKMSVGPYTPLGDDLWGNIYFPAGSVTEDSVSGKLPLVIYLHEYSYATGYHRRSIPFFRRLIEKGFAVLALDMAGFGTRVDEALHFYDRYPRWSLLGKMVSDTRDVINDAYTRMPFIDTGKIYVAGYSLGGTVALFAAALDTRVKGAAVVSAFSSFRNDNKGTEGIRHYAALHGLIPRLGFFIGHEDRIPVDFDEILSCIAPRSLLIIAPKRDRSHSIERVQKIVSPVSALYQQKQAGDKLTFEQPDTCNGFPDRLQQEVTGWMSENAKQQDP
ncbi:alpha/beta fold hydrolase [Agriterribacter sp.]|uniref:alpha/beta fold hydrolase n=1 Tax=Agriterribacter sp. TaxID=2821509 RepID=UPI002D1362E1|nr:alpha/beta fold hydrolase [Agriterribacter sp.]HRP55484.1 alpha/beta fold hydrolase [Agriterribacter sp.]